MSGLNGFTRIVSLAGRKRFGRTLSESSKICLLLGVMPREAVLLNSIFNFLVVAVNYLQKSKIFICNEHLNFSHLVFILFHIRSVSLTHFLEFFFYVVIVIFVLINVALF